jgi:EAL domain-containing protein (putative c-di-GMP-specific phosphodiesterase class I)/DNA-binding response OmpR family regulator
VRDTGAGVAKDRVAGLGLGICRKLIEAMGGRLLVASNPGRGSTFGFEFQPTTLAPASDWPTFDGAQIAVALAGVATRSAVRRYLTSAGAEICASAEGDGQVPPMAIVADPEALARLTPGPAHTVCIGEYGDQGPAELKRAGLAQVVLIQPFRRRDLAAVLGQLAMGGGLSEAQIDEARAEDDALPSFAGRRVLVADASAVGREVAMEALARLGVSTAVAVDGRDAAETAFTEAFDLILMDGGLPVMDGYQAAKAIRAAEAEFHRRRTPIIAVNGEPPGARADAWRDAGMDGALHKPFTLAALARALGSVMEPAAPGVELEAFEPAETMAEAHVAPPAPIKPAPGSDQGRLLEDLKLARERGEFSLVYQKQVDRDGQAVLGVEALLRWNHPTRGVISPALFIPLAEQNGLIRDITGWVLDQAMTETKDLDGGVTLAVNASAVEFSDPEFADELAVIIARHGYDARRLEVEITETAIMAQGDEARRSMDRLHAMGVKTALDDFGVGYSSLSHLQLYPFDKLKIDRMFVNRCSDDVQSATLVQALVSIGRALGMKVVAEGVEDEMQRKFLRAAGAHAMQGFLFGRPAPIAELKRELAGPIAPESQKAAAAR